MKLSEYTLSLLDDIERRISPETEDDYVRKWQDFYQGKCEEAIFVPRRKTTSVSSVAIKDININDAIDDYELMLDTQLAGISKALSSGKGALSMRANYGTGIMTSLFGAEIFVMPRSQNTLPTTRSFNDTDKISAVLESGIPSFEAGFGKKVFEFGEMCREIFEKYPKISKYVYMYHPDTQGPLDIAELLWGSEMFYSMYDEPELVHALIQLITDTYTRFLDKWFVMYPNRSDLNAHWGYLMKGNICLRNDSAMNLSPDFYREFAFKYDQYLLDYYSGGIVHFCGRGDHYIDILSSAENLTGINLSQPHLNDMNKIYTSAFTNRKRLIGLRADACDEYAARPDAVKSMICKA